MASSLPKLPVHPQGQWWSVEIMCSLWLLLADSLLWLLMVAWLGLGGACPPLQLPGRHTDQS